MSQKKLPEKIDSLDIFSTGIELEPIYDDKTIINDYKDIISCGALTEENNQKITDYMKQAKEMLIEQQKQSSYHLGNKNYKSLLLKDDIPEKNSEVIPEKDSKVIPEKKSKVIPEKDSESHDKTSSKITQEVSKLEERINDPDYIPYSRNIQESYFTQRGGNPSQITADNFKQYINEKTGLPRKEIIKSAKDKNLAIFVYKINNYHSIDFIPVQGLRGGTGAIFRNFQLREEGIQYLKNIGSEPEPSKTAPFNSFYYKTNTRVENEFMIKLGTNGLLINTSSNSPGVNHNNVQEMLENRPGIVKGGDILFFNKMTDDEKNRLMKNYETSTSGGYALLAGDAHPSKFIQLRDNSRTEYILHLKDEIFPMCYSERHYLYLNIISMFLPSADLVPRLHHYYDKYENIILNLQHFDSSYLRRAIMNNEIYMGYLQHLKEYATFTNNYLNNLQKHVKEMISATHTPLTDDRYKRIYYHLLQVCSARSPYGNPLVNGLPSGMIPDDRKTQNFLEIDDKEYLTGRDRYCQNTDEKNKPSLDADGAWNTKYPHDTRDLDNQHCLKDSQPWTNNEGLSYTDNCKNKIHEQYAWATKEMCMIISRCPKSVIDDQVQDQYDKKIDHILHNITSGITEAYDWTNPPSLPQFFAHGTATRNFNLGNQGAAVVYSGKFSDSGDYDDFGPLKPFKTLYRGSSFNIFNQSDQVITQHFLSTSTNVNNTVNVFVEDTGYLLILKLAQDVPYMPLSNNIRTAKTCYANEDEILLPPGCRLTRKNSRDVTIKTIRRNALGVFTPKNIKFTIYSVYVDYINETQHNKLTNLYFDERCPFGSLSREGPVENLFKNEIRIDGRLIDNKSEIEERELDNSFKEEVIVIEQHPDNGKIRSFPTQKSVMATTLNNFWGALLQQSGGNINNSPSQKKNDIKKLLQPKTSVKPGNFSKKLTK